MNLFRYAIFALSVALVFSVGSSSATTHSHPEISVADDRTLSLRGTGSQIVMETIEDAIRQGGLALLGEGFQIDSSLSYVTEESSDGIFRGEIDLVIPFWSKNGHVIFTQPGFVFWEGPAEEERVDGNLGIVYRTNLAKTPVGIDAVAGASLFYDYDFHRVNHERLGIGVDMQSGNFHGAFNYYYPLSNEEGGREGFIEEALKGMDLRFALERETIRAGARLGLWRYDGGEDVADEWRSSVGFDAGFRILPGVFIEGEWEKHQEDVILDQRLSLGLAFRFSLPGFEGQSYRDGLMSSDLYRIVEREKRVLYEEREAGPTVSIVRTGNEAVVEGGKIAMNVQLSEVLEENVTINLVGGGRATYNDDWTISVGGTDCTGVSEDNCQTTIAAGQISTGVVVTINRDGRGESAESIILSTAVADAGNTGLTPGSPMVLDIPADPLLPTVWLNYSGSGKTLTIDEGIIAMLNLSEALSEDVTVNLATSGTAQYGDTNEWDLARRVPAGDEDANYSLCDTTCEVVFEAGQTSADIQFTAHFGSAGKTVGAEIQIPTAAQSLVQVGSPSRLDFTIVEAPPPPPRVSMSADTTSITEGSTATITVTLSRAIENNATFNLIGGGTGATYGTSSSSDWNLSVGGMDCNMASRSSPCRVTINAGARTAEVIVEVREDMTLEAREDFTVSVEVASGSTSMVTPGSTSMLNFDIPSQIPTVSLAYNGPSRVPEDVNLRMMIVLSKPLEEEVTMYLVRGGNAIYGPASDNQSRDDWVLHRRVIPANEMPPDSYSGGGPCSGADAQGTKCGATIPEGATIVDVQLEVYRDPYREEAETMTVEIVIGSAGSTGLVLGSPTKHEITVPKHTTSRFTDLSDPCPVIAC